MSTFELSKETPTMKIYRGGAAQVFVCRRRTHNNLRRSSRLSDHTTYMQTSTVMNLLCVYMCASSYIDLLHSALLSSLRCLRLILTPHPINTSGKVFRKGRLEADYALFLVITNWVVDEENVWMKVCTSCVWPSLLAEKGHSCLIHSKHCSRNMFYRIDK